MSIRDFSTPPQVRVSTPQGIGWLERIWRLGDTWMSTVDHVETIQLYPLDALRPVRTDKLGPQMTHVVRRPVRRPSVVRRVLALLPLVATIVMVGLAWLYGWGL